MRRKQRRDLTQLEKISIRRSQNKMNLFSEKRKAVQFSYDVQQTLEYLESIAYDEEGAAQIINEILEDPQKVKIGYLIKIITSTDLKMKICLVTRLGAILDMTETKLEEPEGVILLGNLCSLFEQFRNSAIERGLIFKITTKMHELRHQPDFAAMYSWTLCQLIFESNNIKDVILFEAINKIYRCLQHENLPTSHNHATNLIRAISYISHTLQFQKQFIKFILQRIVPKFCVNAPMNHINIFLSIVNQVKMMRHESEVQYSKSLLKYLIGNYSEMPKNIQEELPCLYAIILVLLEKSQNQLIDCIIAEFPQMIEYKYSSLPFLKFLEEVISRMPINQQSIHYLSSKTSLIENLIHDLNDPNKLLAYRCLRIMKLIIEIVLGNGMMDELQWMLSLGIQENIEQLLSEVHGNEKIAEIAESILENISN